MHNQQLTNRESAPGPSPQPVATHLLATHLLTTHTFITNKNRLRGVLLASPAAPQTPAALSLSTTIRLTNPIAKTYYRPNSLPARSASSFPSAQPLAGSSTHFLSLP